MTANTLDATCVISSTMQIIITCAQLKSSIYTINSSHCEAQRAVAIYFKKQLKEEWIASLRSQ